MNRKQLEQCAWDNTPVDERRDRKEHRVLPKFGTKAGKRVQLAEARQRVRKLTGNNREIRVFDPSGSTPGTMSPWVPLWSLYNDELTQRCAQGREPKLRAPYTRTRRDYKSSLESVPVMKPQHATKKSAAQINREIAAVLVPHSAKGDRILVDLARWGVDRALIDEVRAAFRGGDPRRAMALARDLGWTRASKRGRAFR